ncbi:MAG: polysaccharide deacetylase family protein [Candidatus Omnitrophica bacterium]|nr:polysaccharide deacetylase family protein [Candidatus Omnitrophota bacterium]
MPQKDKIKKIIKWIIAVSIYYSGALSLYRRFFKKWFVPNNIIILRYHRVLNNEKKDAINISVHMRSLEKQLLYMKRFFNIMSIPRIVEGLSRNHIFSKPTVGITFDDGYKDNYICAFPLLKKYNAPATIFLTVGHIDNNIPFPWDAPETANSDAEDIAILSWDDIYKMNDDLISFGSHTISHPKLSSTSAEKVYDELVGSRRVLSGAVTNYVDLFSYPFGDFNEQTKDCVKRAGYKAAFTTRDGFCKRVNDLFLIKRKAIHENLVKNPFGRFSKSLFALEIEGLMDLLLPSRSYL